MLLIPSNIHSAENAYVYVCGGILLELPYNPSFLTNQKKKRRRKTRQNNYRWRQSSPFPSAVLLTQLTSHFSGESPATFLSSIKFLMVGANIMTSLVDLTSLKLLIPKDSKSRLLTALSCAKLIPIQLTFSHVDRPFTISKFKRMAWSVRSATDDNRLNSSPTNDSNGGTRLIRTIQAIQFKIIARFKELMKNLPVKLFSFLVGFYCATAFATVIGQTGDWDVLSAALTVAVVEGIGALMYKASLPLVDNIRNLIIIFNYWKAGLSLGLFLDSFKY